jgi:hypothetical protein
MRRVIIETPYVGDVDGNVAYARRAMRDALQPGEAPIVSRLLHARSAVLDDAISDQRELDADAGDAWLAVAEACVVYTDLGISDRMWRGIEAARKARVPVEFRKLGRLTTRLLRLAAGRAQMERLGGQELIARSELCRR